MNRKDPGAGLGIFLFGRALHPVCESPGWEALPGISIRSWRTKRAASTSPLSGQCANGVQPATILKTDLFEEPFGGLRFSTICSRKRRCPRKFVRDPFSTPSPCAPVYPWNFIRTNTIYGVIHAAGGFTAWSDKHAVYPAVSGPTGTNKSSNLSDYYSPEVNSNQIPLPGVVTAGTNFDCSTIQPSGSATVPGNDWTTDFQAIQCYDQLKVKAVVNWR